MMPPKCYTWLESCGSQLSDGKNEKLFFCILQSVGFSRTLRTDIFLYTEKLSYVNVICDSSDIFKLYHNIGQCCTQLTNQSPRDPNFVRDCKKRHGASSSFGNTSFEEEKKQ